MLCANCDGNGCEAWALLGKQWWTRDIWKVGWWHEATGILGLSDKNQYVIGNRAGRKEACNDVTVSVEH